MTSGFAQFDDAFARATSDLDGGEETVPTAVSIAASVVLPVSAVSVSIAIGTHRLPLGASSAAAALAESLQFTVGDGPCLEAIRTGTVIDAPTPRFSRRWPPLFDLYRRRTPYRSVASLPLHTGQDIHGAMNLFFIHEWGGRDLNLLQAQLVTAKSATLIADWADSNQHNLDTALNTANAARRHQIWVAVGMLMERAHINGVDSLAVLRAHAYRNDNTVDELAQQLTAGTVAVADLFA